MSHARQHGRDHSPIRPYPRVLSCLRSPGARACAHWVAETPALPVLVLCVIVAIDMAAGTGRIWLPLLATGPALAAATSRPRGVLGVGALAVLLGTGIAHRHDMALAHLSVVLAALVTVTLAGTLTSALRARRERVLAAVRSVAETAQHALLQPVPETVGPFQAAVRYSAAAAEARIGGDLYALVPTPYGVRMIVGDVRGKGLPAVGTAALVLGVFREAAYDEPDLLDVVGRIERSLARNLGGDDFVTAVVAGCPEPGRLEVVNCGHAPPLLIRGTEVTAVDPVRPTPPLGLRALSEDTPRLQVVPFGDGDQLLLYTDGVTEARDADRAFYPLTEGVSRHLCDEPARTLAALHEDLLDHVGGRLHDDAALLLLRRPAAAQGGEPAGAPLVPDVDGATAARGASASGPLAPRAAGSHGR
ncbi:PP2C family protein-serine/threonine phosphatase [Streptomyces erythrogriseus]|uniref:PP2C family protein-serine/threonine phosphatase n=1 Tax=Streptomyces erythrogriseus TaxID=284027 RepID=A0ABN3XD91_9ACTN